jgi:hypothetical protein
MILQFGKIPPPIGGISIHIKRLLSEFENSTLKMELLDYSKERNVFSIIKKVWRNKIVHLHLSRKRHRLVFILLFRGLLKKVVVTFHGEFDFKNRYDYFSLKYASYGIVLNEVSLKNATKYRKKNVYLIGAFIPPETLKTNSLRPDSIILINQIKKEYKNVFCTNAWNVVLDKNGNEIYGGSLLVELFNKNTKIALIFSDPASNYQPFLLKKYKNLPTNVFFLNYQHDFVDVIKTCDAFIRATTTDGDSLSVHEAMNLGKDVIASTVIDRPEGCILYTTEADLGRCISNFNLFKYSYKNYIFKNNIIELQKLYLKISE